MATWNQSRPRLMIDVEPTCGEEGIYEPRFAAGDPSHWPSLATGLVDRKVNVIVAGSRDAAKASANRYRDDPDRCTGRRHGGGGLVANIVHPRERCRSRRRSGNLLHLTELQLDRRRPAVDRHTHFEARALLVDLYHMPLEGGERTVGHPYLFAGHERDGLGRSADLFGWGR